MPNWTREHDAHIARECEGLETWEGDHKELFGAPKGQPEKWRRVPLYQIDPHARDRAAEAWRRQVEGRSYETHSAVDDAFGHRNQWATCFSGPQRIAGSGDGEHALLWALWKATTKDSKE